MFRMNREDAQSVRDSLAECENKQIKGSPAVELLSLDAVDVGKDRVDGKRESAEQFV